MYEKIIILVVIFCFLFTGCRSTDVHDNRNGIDDVREDLLELQAEQRNIEERLTEVADGFTEIENTISDGIENLEAGLEQSLDTLSERTDDYAEFERILADVRRRNRCNDEPAE